MAAGRSRIGRKPNVGALQAHCDRPAVQNVGRSRYQLALLKPERASRIQQRCEQARIAVEQGRIEK